MRGAHKQGYRGLLGCYTNRDRGGGGGERAAAVKTVFVINLPPYVYDRCYVRNVFGDVDQISTQHRSLTCNREQQFCPKVPCFFYEYLR